MEKPIEQMSLEEYKQIAKDYLKKKYPLFTEAKANLESMKDEEWQEYLDEKFTPQSVAEAMAMGII